jgi:hypothetical protein
MHGNDDNDDDAHNYTHPLLCPFLDPRHFAAAADGAPICLDKRTRSDWAH